MARYVITGGAGFIGSHLCDLLLEQGHEAVVFDDLSTGHLSNIPAGAAFIEGDITDAAAITQAMTGADGCFHLAAVASVAASNERWVDTHGINLTGTINVFEAARDNGHRPVVYASSAAVYGATDQMPLVETAEKRPLTAYGADKYGCELHAMPALLVHGVPSTGLRFFNVYGPRQDPSSPYSGVISVFAKRIAAGEEVLIHGDGSQSRDFVYVADVCRALLSAMKNTRDNATVYNVCTGVETSVLDLAKMLAGLTGYNREFQFGSPRTGDILRSIGSNTAMITKLGVTPETDLADGLRTTVESMR